MASQAPVKSSRRTGREAGGLDRSDSRAVDGDSISDTEGDCVSTKQKKDGEKDAPVALGRVLEEHITGWIGRVERTGHWKRRSDIHQRLMAEVERIVIRAALEKTSFVQTDAADFLGINRNTLAKKIRAYGIRRA